MRVKDLPACDRPRERLLGRGAEALADRELLALLLGSGARGLDAVELAGQLIVSQGGLRRLAKAAPHELVDLLGIGPAKTARVAAAFQLARRALNDEQPTCRRVVATADIAACAAPLLRGLRHERVVVIVCDKAGAVLHRRRRRFRRSP
jgi:DNA repair protein RadC